MNICEIVIMWLNTNQGAVMVILTFVYVIATLLIVLSNREILKQNRDIQKQNAKLELFDKRFNLYLKIRNAFSEFLTLDQDIMMRAFGELGGLRDEVYYLFGDDITKYYVEIINNAEKLNANLHTPKTEEYKQSLHWLIAQFEKREMRTRFEKYLHLRQYGLSD